MIKEKLLRNEQKILPYQLSVVKGLFNDTFSIVK